MATCDWCGKPGAAVDWPMPERKEEQGWLCRECYGNDDISAKDVDARIRARRASAQAETVDRYLTKRYGEQPPPFKVGDRVRVKDARWFGGECEGRGMAREGLITAIDDDLYAIHPDEEPSWLAESLEPAPEATSAKGEDLPPLDFVAPRDFTTDTDSDDCCAYGFSLIRSGTRVRAVTTHGGYLHVDAGHPQDACPKCAARAHAELCRLRDGVAFDEVQDVTPELVRVVESFHIPADDPDEPGPVSEWERARVATDPHKTKRPLWRHQFVESVVLAQVASGGVDTPGTRAEAERWCAMLAGCVCEGMRATTASSAWRLTERDTVSYPDSPTRYWSGTPLGRP